MSEELIKTESVNDATLVVSMNRPDKRNALNIPLVEGLRTTLHDASRDLKRRVVVLRGEGTVFCSGLDLKEMADPTAAHRSAEALAWLYEEICKTPLIVVVEAHGVALGGGAGFIAAADLVVASDDLRVGFPEVRRGLVAALVTSLLRRQVGDRALREIILLGQTLDTDRCLSLGIVNRVVPAGELHEAALALATEVVTGAPDALVRTKRLLDELAPRPVVDDLKIAQRHHMISRQSHETVEGLAAFHEKRAPVWGRRSEE